MWRHDVLTCDKRGKGRGGWEYVKYACAKYPSWPCEHREQVCVSRGRRGELLETQHISFCILMFFLFYSYKFFYFLWLFIIKFLIKKYNLIKKKKKIDSFHLSKKNKKLKLIIKKKNFNQFLRKVRYYITNYNF